MATTCYSIIEDAIQDLLQGHSNTTIDAVDQDGPISEYQRLKVESDALESQIRVLRDAKRATDMACDLEPLNRSRNTMESPRKKDLRQRRYNEERLSTYRKGYSREPAGDPMPSTLEWTEKTIESVIETLTQEQVDETCKNIDLESNLPWNSPLVIGPLVVRDQLQQRLSPLEKQLADLRWQQNTLIPIARLLPELLIDVFEHLMDAAYYLSRDDVNLVLVVLARICRDWTRLVFNTPCLWSRISPASSALKHVAAALARSKPGPLSVHFHAYHSAHIEPRHFLGTINGHADRLKVLDLDLGSPELIGALNSICAKVYAPRLQKLRISLTVSGSAETWPEISFFKGPWHDALQHLRVNGVRLPLGGYGELRGLRSLMLTLIQGQMVPSTTEIVRALYNSPGLEILSISSLTELGGELSVGTGNLMTPVRLDRLREIILRLSPAPLHAILRSILPTKLLKVLINTTLPYENKSAWTEVLLTNEIQPFVQALESVLHSIQQISIQCDPLHVRLWQESNNRKDNTPFVDLMLAGVRLTEVGRWMATSLDLGPAEVTLYMADGTTPWTNTVPFLLSKFHNIVKLNIDEAEWVAQRAIDFLCTPRSTASTGAQNFPVPRLVSLSAGVRDPSSIMSILERRYIQHGSADGPSTKQPVALSRLRLWPYTMPPAPYSTLEQRSASFLPGCDTHVVLIRR